MNELNKIQIYDMTNIIQNQYDSYSLKQSVYYEINKKVC